MTFDYEEKSSRSRFVEGIWRTHDTSDGTFLAAADACWDMIFIRSDGRILNIAENTTPMSENEVPSTGPVQAVLEVRGGTARKLGIAPGDRVANPIFRSR